MTRVCILEWLSCGGMHAVDASDVPCDLRHEGWAMLKCLAGEFSQAGHNVTTILDRRLVSDVGESVFQSELVHSSDFCSSLSNVASQLDGVNRTLAVWTELASQCDAAVVIAPELDGILERCVSWLIQSGVPLINCSGHFLRACCDKWITAKLFASHNIAHPWTSLDTYWNNENRDFNFERWCLKPRFGCGCERLFVSDAAGARFFNQVANSQRDCITQQWIEGKPFSCSAIVSRSGAVTWLPLMTQELVPRHVQIPSQSDSSAPNRGQAFAYQGSQLATDEIQQIKPIELLETAFRSLLSESATNARQPEALGWVSFDLVLDSSGKWWVIEVNSRLTTSIVQLARNLPYNLAHKMLENFAT